MSLEKNDLKRLVHSEIHIDDFKSKMGEDKDIVVISFKVTGKEPANDLVDFIEKGYEWVVDADVSSGEMDDGDYIVFIEIPRDRDSIAHIIELAEDLEKVTDLERSDWRVRYYHDTKDHPMDETALKGLVPLTSSEYESRFGHKELDKLKAISGIEVKTKAPKNELTDSLRIAAGIL
jgi:hypothetical protein